MSLRHLGRPMRLHVDGKSTRLAPQLLLRLTARHGFIDADYHAAPRFRQKRMQRIEPDGVGVPTLQTTCNDFGQDAIAWLQLGRKAAGGSKAKDAATALCRRIFEFIPRDGAGPTYGDDVLSCCDACFETKSTEYEQWKG